MAPVSHNYLRIAIPFHGFSHEFQCRGLIARLRNERLQNFALMIDSAPKVMLLAIDTDEYFIDEEGIAVPSVLPFQSAGIDDDYRY